MRIHTTWLHVLSTLVICAVPGAVTWAEASENDTFILPQGLTEFQISELDILTNDAAGAILLSHSPTGRGELISEPGGFLYRPAPEFWEKGMDHFTYRSQTTSASVSALVFLVAEVLDPPTVALDLEVTASPEEIRITQGAIDSSSVSHPFWEVRVTPAEEAYLKVSELSSGCELPDIGCGQAPSGDDGGKIGGDIDVSGFTTTSEEPVTLARYVTEGASRVELSLRHAGAGYQVRASSRQRDGSHVATGWVPLPGGVTSVYARWWSATSFESQDGGVALEIDQRIAASRTGLDNAGMSPTPLDPQADFGYLQGLQPDLGPYRLDRPRLWHGQARRPGLMPLFADHAESAELSGWSQTVGNVAVTSQVVIAGSRSFEAPAVFPSSAYFVDRSPADSNDYRARFAIDLRDLSLAEGQAVTVLEGSDPISGSGFLLRIRRQSSALLLCADAALNDGSRSAEGCAEIAAATSATVDVHWWALASGGGLQVRIDEPPIPQIRFQELDNDGQSITEARLGVMNPVAGTAGKVYFDDFESWE